MKFDFVNEWGIGDLRFDFSVTIEGENIPCEYQLKEKSKRK